MAYRGSKLLVIYCIILPKVGRSADEMFSLCQNNGLMFDILHLNIGGQRKCNLLLDPG